MYGQAAFGRPRREQDDERGDRCDGDAHPRHGQEAVVVAVQHRVPARVEQGGEEDETAGITEHAGPGERVIAKKDIYLVAA